MITYSRKTLSADALKHQMSGESTKECHHTYVIQGQGHSQAILHVIFNVICFKAQFKNLNSGQYLHEFNHTNMLKTGHRHSSIMFFKIT